MKIFNKLRKNYGYEEAVIRIKKLEKISNTLYIICPVIAAILLFMSMTDDLYILFAISLIIITMVLMNYVDKAMSYISIEKHMNRIGRTLRSYGIEQYKYNTKTIEIIYNNELEMNELTLKVKLDNDDDYILYNSDEVYYINGPWDEEVYDLCNTVTLDIEGIKNNREKLEQDKLSEVMDKYKIATK